MDLSVIVPCHNEEATLDAQLDALSTQDYAGAWEVVVVDNNSTDATAAIVTARIADWPELRLVTANEGQGLCYARNVGVEASEGRLLLFCDGDDVAAPGWVSALAAGLETNPLVTGRVEVDLLNPAWLTTSRGDGGRDGPPRFADSFDYASGGNQGMSRDLWERAGRFAEGVAGAEDMEFSLRCLALGVEVTEAPDAIIHYRYRSSAGALFRQGRTYGSCRPLIVRHMLEAGMNRPPYVLGWRSWLWLIAKAPTLVTSHGRANWAWVAGNRIGHIEGSIRHRTLFL